MSAWIPWTFLSVFIQPSKAKKNEEGEQRWKKEGTEGKVEKEKAVRKDPPQLGDNSSASNFENENLSQKNDSIFLFTFFFDAAKLSCQENEF